MLVDAISVGVEASLESGEGENVGWSLGTPADASLEDCTKQCVVAQLSPGLDAVREINHSL